jgi:hypothetical protein
LAVLHDHRVYYLPILLKVLDESLCSKIIQQKQYTDMIKLKKTTKTITPNQIWNLKIYITVLKNRPISIFIQYHTLELGLNYRTPSKKKNSIYTQHKNC